MVKAPFQCLEKKLLVKITKGMTQLLSDLHACFTSEAGNFMFGDLLLSHSLDLLVSKHSCDISGGNFHLGLLL